MASLHWQHSETFVIRTYGLVGNARGFKITLLAVVSSSCHCSEREREREKAYTSENILFTALVEPQQEINDTVEYEGSMRVLCCHGVVQF